MKTKEIIIKIDESEINIKGIDDGIFYVVKVLYKDYCIPPIYSYNYQDFNNKINSEESGIFYGDLDETFDEFIKIIKSDTKLKEKINKIDYYLNAMK